MPRLNMFLISSMNIIIARYCRSKQKYYLQSGPSEVIGRECYCVRFSRAEKHVRK